MKNLVAVLTFLFLGNYICVAQADKPGQGHRIEAVKAAFFTRQLNLTADEAQKFWPVYNPYFAELKKAKQENRGNQLQFEENALAIRKKYKPEFLKILGSEERVNKLFVTELRFVDMLRKELAERRRNRNNK